jgi:hypothetical protein
MKSGVMIPVAMSSAQDPMRVFEDAHTSLDQGITAVGVRRPYPSHPRVDGGLYLVGGMWYGPLTRVQATVYPGITGSVEVQGSHWSKVPVSYPLMLQDLPGFARMSFQTAPEVPGRDGIRTGRPWTRQCMSRWNGVRKTCIPVHGTKVERIHGPADHYLRSVICRECLSTKRESATAIYQVHRHETCGIQGTLEQPIRRSRVLGEYRGDRR